MRPEPRTAPGDALNEPSEHALLTTHIPSLDGIRALSFLVVFAAHAGLDGVLPGGFGVTVFFFLSGFLITTMLRLEHDARGTIALGQFYLRRALRILPPFYLVLALATLAAVAGLLPGDLDARAVAAQALHGANYWIATHGYFGQPSGTGVNWSLAVEEHFYLVFPCLYLVLRRFVATRAHQARIIWALCAAFLAWRVVLVYGLHAPMLRTYVATDTRADSILFGCALGILGAEAPARPSISERTWKRVLLPAGLLLLLLTFVVRDESFRQTFRYTLQGLALYPLFVVAVRYPTWGPLPLLGTKLMSRLGALSYSLYLVHHVVLDALRPSIFGAGVLHAAVAFVVSLALAWTIYRLVEKPAARWRRRLSFTMAAREPRRVTPLREARVP